MWALIKNIIIDSLEQLYREDRILFKRNTGRGLAERCIVFRFAHYLQKKIDNCSELLNYFVDCDYNSSSIGEKEISGKLIPDENGKLTGRFIDIIVHKRGSGGNSNFICFEIKKWNNKTRESMTKDRNNLQVLVTEYGYDYGFHIILGKILERTKIRIYSRFSNSYDEYGWADFCNL